MNDLRHDQEAEDAATHARLRCNTTWYAGSDASSQRLEPSQLRTVRQTDPRYPDTRTADERTTAELVRLVDELQALKLRQEWNAADIADLRDQVRALSEDLKAGRL